MVYPKFKLPSSIEKLTVRIEKYEIDEAMLTNLLNHP